MKFLVFTLLVLFSFAASAGEEYICPQRIKTSQKLYGEADGWRESTERPFSTGHWDDVGYSEHNLDYVAFFDGVPEERGSLVPDQETPIKKGQWTSTWKIVEPGKIWFTCQYRGTSVQLSKKLPEYVKTCTVKYNRNRGINVEEVKCF